jgi:hypothetical protein
MSADLSHMFTHIFLIGQEEGNRSPLPAMGFDILVLIAGQIETYLARASVKLLVFLVSSSNCAVLDIPFPSSQRVMLYYTVTATLAMPD